MVYATANKVHSGSAEVSSYLFELREDLHIEEDGYPKYVLIGGDQQTCYHEEVEKLISRPV